MLDLHVDNVVPGKYIIRPLSVPLAKYPERRMAYEKLAAVLAHPHALAPSDPGAALPLLQNAREAGRRQERGGGRVVSSDESDAAR